MHMNRRAIAGVLVAGLALLGSACSDDDEDTAETGSAPEEETTTTAPDADGDESEEGGAPDVNPCAEGESGTLAPPTPAADGATEVAVTASEYSFEGLDAVSGTGDYAITLTNDGQELHELVLVRLPDSETRPIEEILASGEEPETTDVAFTFACPGATAETTGASITEPGRYVALCFIPVGTTPETDPAEFENGGPPHAVQGMIQEIVIAS